jgi:hypothetical protein
VDVLDIMLRQMSGERQRMRYRRQARLKRPARGDFHAAARINSIDPFAAGNHLCRDRVAEVARLPVRTLFLQGQPY